MRAVVQRVRSASVEVGEEIVSRIGAGFLVLLGVAHGGSEAEAVTLADKIVKLRVFEDKDGKMNRSLGEIEGEDPVVSQFTLYADCRKGRRPGFIDAAFPEQGEQLYDFFCRRLARTGVPPGEGRLRSRNAGPAGERRPGDDHLGKKCR